MSNVLENILRKIGRELADNQVARFWKVPEGVTQTPCDFFGYTRTGRAILIEAKSVQRARLPIGKSPGLLRHQWNELCDAARAGAVSLVVWSAYQRVAVLRVADYMDTEAKSIEWNREWVGADYDSLHIAIEETLYL